MSIYEYSVFTPQGEEISLKDYAGKVLIIVNTATGCGFTPHYKELEALYEDYRDRGFLILGIYSAEGQEADVDKVLEDSSTSYPILRYSKDFDGFQSGYVPTTVFVDGEGTILSELLVGGRDYAGWEELILSTLK